MEGLIAFEGLSLRRPPRQGAKPWRMEVEAFTLHPGARIGLIGESGSGKSTFLDFLALIARPEGIGKFSLAGEDVTRLVRNGKGGALARRRSRNIGYVLQDGGLLPYLTVRANAGLARSLSGRRDLPGLDQIAGQLGIAGHLDKRPAHLSGGQRQRAQVLRGLATGAQILLADEPTAALDNENAHRTFQALTSAPPGTALVVASHWPELLRDFGFFLCRVSLREYPGEVVAELQAAEGLA
ncbi:ATP-binding cassette domain-containing protein [Xinfangfangia sp. D13-10-4-6]|uniref:ABC transporter ATP-binding protein n=1 Tax=Pseudogemmobacter hezensis TaxID=2737662 RepID=UPI00155710AA|nr:ATP-binding cassette domain-containing protein [Pseudogemmobacter hezensis]NPD15993.1 ATP-binding cassette domain-containing protein [Pseudogemmobacter hezensis]